MWGFRGTHLLSVLFLSLVWCGKSYALKNSYPDYDPDSRFNVFITGTAISGTEDFPFMCNGSLITKNLVVTAAHCLSGSINLLNTLTVDVGTYHTTPPNAQGNSLSLYIRDKEKHRVRNIYFTNAIKKKLSRGPISESSISTSDDIAIIELEVPVGFSGLTVKPVSFVSKKEYEEIKQNPKKYFFKSITINYWDDISTENKRYAPMGAIYIEKMLGVPFGKSIISFDTYHEEQPGDSGGPLLVGVHGQWKLIGIVKGIIRDTLSQAISDLLSQKKVIDVNITPVRNLYATVPDKICSLIQQTNDIEAQKLCEK